MQTKEDMSGEEDEIARMANLYALLHHEFGFWWTGFYRVAEDDMLVLGPFQGPPACSRIRIGEGVCGTAWAEDRTIVAVLDIDSRELGTFDKTDAKYMEKIADCIYGPQRDIWFAAGCFWGAQKFFKMIQGVEFTEVGFANGWKKNPTYKEVYTDTTGHAECVHVRYNPEIVPLKELVRLYFRIIDPLSLNRQGEDEGTRYRTGVYYEDERDFDILSKEFFRVEKKLGAQLAVELRHISSFYRAEEYHQDYLDKNPGGYCHLSPEMFTLAAKYKKK